MLNFFIKFKFNKVTIFNSYLSTYINMLLKADWTFIYKFEVVKNTISTFSQVRKYNVEGSNDLQSFLYISNNSTFNLCFITNCSNLVNCILKDKYIIVNIYNYFNNIVNNFIFLTFENNSNVILKSANTFLLYNTRRSSVFMLNFKFIDHRRYFNIIFKDLTYIKLDTLSMHTLLRQRYGIGYKISTILCKHLGMSDRFKTANLPITIHYNKLSTFFSNNLENLDTNLMNFSLKKHSDAIQIRSYKGIRLLKGYPINGQRTRSNHKTAQRKPYRFLFYYV